MKKRKATYTQKHTMNSRVYKMAMRVNLGCPICAPNRGCNRNRDNDSRCWKTYRKDQPRE